MDLTALREKLEETPTDFKAFEAIQGALLKEQNLDELGQIYRQVLGAIGEDPARDRILRLIDVQARTFEDENTQGWLNFELGRLYWEVLENPDRAEVYFRRIKDREEAQEVTGRFYEAFYIRRDNWRRLEQFLVERGQDPIEVKRKLAGIAEQKGNTEKAIAFWQAVYTAGEADAATFDTLRKMYAEVGKWHSLVELLKSQLKSLDSEDKAGAVAVHMEMLNIYRDHIKSDTRVISTWQQIIKLQPDNVQALDALQTLYEELNRWPDLARVMQSRIDCESDPSKQLALHRRIANIMLERFSNSSEAIKHYQDILAIEADDLEALTKLKGLYEQRKNWDEYVAVSRRLIALNQGDGDEETAILELARLVSERIRHPAIAIELWEDVHRVRPDDAEALQQLEALYEREKRFDRLLEIMEARYEHIDSDEERVKALEKMGFIVGTRLQNPEGAADVWERLLGIEPGHRKAFNELRKRALEAKQWSTLETLFRAHATLPELIRSLESEANQIEGKAKIDLLERVASLATEADQPTRAIKAFEAILALESGHLGAARGLIPAYERQRAWQKLPPVYDVVLEATRDRDERQVLLKGKAAVYEEHLKDLDAAFFCAVEAYKEHPSCEEARATLDRLGELSGNWEVYVSVLEQVAQTLTDQPAAATALLLQVADVVQTRLSLPHQALIHYRDVLQRFDPTNMVALAATEQIYRETQQWPELVDVLHQKLERGGLSRDDEKALRIELGAVWRDELDEPEAAMAVYRELMARFPDEMGVYDELAHLHLQLEDWDRLEEVLRRKMACLVDMSDASAPELASLHCKLGMLMYSTRGDTAAAIEHYTDALAVDDGCDLAVRSLEELLASTEHRGNIARALEPIYRAQEDWAHVADALEIQVADGPAKRQKISLLKRLISLYAEQINDKERALWASSRLMKLDPEKKSLHAGIEALVEELAEWSVLVDLYEEQAPSIQSDELRVVVYEKAARAAREQLFEPQRAEVLYRRILDEDPTHIGALNALENLYEETDDAENLLGILRQKESLCEGVDERVEFRFQTASLLAERLHRIDDAIEDMRAVLDWRPEHNVALIRLDDLYGRAERWDDLHGVLKERIKQAEADEEKVSLLVRQAELEAGSLSVPSKAIKTYGKVLRVNATHPSAVKPLEGMLESDGLAPAAARVLEKAYKQADNWQGLIRVYEVQQQAAEEPSEKETLHFQLASLHEERGGSTSRAFEHVGYAYRLVPDNVNTVAELLRLTDGLENYQELADLLKSAVDDALDPERRREIHRVVAQTLSDRCDNPDGAITHYVRVLDHAPDDLPAVDALVALYRGQESYDALVDMLRRKAEFMAVDEMRVELLQEAGGLASGPLANTDLGIEIYEDVLRCDADNDAALNALRDLYERAQGWTELCGVLDRQISKANSAEAQIALAREMAGVQQRHLEDLNAAIATHRRILEWSESDLAALNALDVLLTETQNWHDLIHVLDQQSSLVEPEAKTVLGLRKANVFSVELEDAPSAIGVLKGLLDSDRFESRFHDALENLIRTSPSREEAFAVLEPILVEREEHERLVTLLDTLVANREDPAGRIDSLHRMGSITETHLREPQRAFVCFGRALREQVDHGPSMEAVERLASTHVLWEELTALLGQISQELSDPNQQCRLQLRSAEVLKDEIADLDRAIEAYCAILAEHPDDATALEALDELYVRTERWSDLSTILETQVDRAQDVEERTALYLRLAENAEHRLGQPEEAVRCYSEVFYQDAQNRAVWEQLERLARAGIQVAEVTGLLEPVYMEQSEWTKVHDMLELRLTCTHDPLDRGELFRRLGTLNLEQLDQVEKAIHWLGQAFELDASDEDLLGRLDALVAQTGEYSGHKDRLLAVAASADDVERKISLWQKAATILEEQLVLPDEAEQVHQLVLQEDDENLVALQALDRLYVSQERWAELEGTLERLVDTASLEDEQVDLLMRLGAIQRDQLEKPDDAVASFHRALAIDEGHREALQALAALYRIQERHDDLFEVLRQLTEVSDSDHDRLAYLREMARLAEVNLQRTEDAVELWEEVLGLDPTSVDSVQNQQRIFRASANHERLVDCLEREVGMIGDGNEARAIELYRELGSVWAMQLGDSMHAQEAWQKLLALDASDVEAMQALCGIYEASENMHALCGVLEQMVSSLHFEGEELCGLYMKLARLFTDDVPHPEKAIAAWQKVREMEPNDLETVEALERLFTDAGRWEEAVPILRAKAALVPADQVVPVWMALGEIEQYQLTRWEQATAAYQSVVALEPGHMDAGERLETLYTEHQQWASLAKLFEDRVAHTEDQHDKRDLLIRLADINETHLDEMPVAFLFLQAAHRENAGDTEILESLERVGTAAELYHELTQEFELALESFEDDEERIEVHLKSARIHRDRLNRVDDAVRHFRGVLSVDAEHEDTLRELADVLRDNERWEDLVAVQESRIDLASDPKECTAINLEVGQVHRDRLGNVDAAVVAYRRVLDSGDSNTTAVKALESLFTEHERWEDLIGILEIKAGMAMGDETALRLQIGQILERNIGDMERAIRCYEEILDFDDTQRDALHRLLDLYAVGDNFEKLTGVYERLLDTAQTDHERLEFCEKLALLQRQVQDDAEAAADYYHRMLTIDPNHAGALAALEEIYEGLEHWEDLIDVYRRHLEQLWNTMAATEDSQGEAADGGGINYEEEWINYQGKVANVYRVRLNDPDSAIDAYRTLLEQQASNWDSLDALEQLYRDAEQPEAVQDILARKATHAATADERNELMTARAEIVFSQLHDHAGAIDVLNKVLEDAPGDTRTLSLLERIYSAREEWDNVIDVLNKRDLHVGTDRQKAEIQREIALIHRDKLHNEANAVDHLEMALELIPDDVESADILSGLYVQSENWVKAEALLNLIVNRDGWAENTAPAHQAEVRLHRGQALENLLRPEDALLEYEIAYNVDPSNVEAMKSLSRVAMATGDLERAEAMHMAVIDRIEAQADDSELVVHYRALGEIALGQGDDQTACEYLEKTLLIQPRDVAAHESLMTLSEKQGKWHDVIRYATDLQDFKSEALEKFDLQLRIGDVYLKQLEEPEEAVQAYRRALDFQPDSKAAHLKIFQVLVDAESYGEAVETLTRLVELEKDGRRKGSYYGAIADVYRDKLGDDDQAVHYFNLGLDCDPTHLKAFRGIDEILTDRKDWAALQKNYRTMLVRVQDDESQSALQFKLCFNLGEIYRTRLKEMNKAAAAFEAALDVQPDDVKTVEILSQLHLMEDEKDRAIVRFRQLLTHQPGELKHYRTLKKLFMETQNKDAAWMACGVLALLGQADDPERTFYEENATGEMVTSLGSVDEDIWASHLVSRGEDLLLGQVYQTLYQGLGDKLARKTSKEIGLRKKDEIDLSQRELFTHVFSTSSDILGIAPLPKVYHSVQSSGMHIEELVPPVIMIGDELRQGKTEQELAFVLGKVLTYFHPMHLAVCVAPPESLQALFQATASHFVADYDGGNGSSPDAVATIREVLEELPSQVRGHLEQRVQEHVHSGQSLNVHRWLNQIELTANHAGLFLCNDVVLAGRMLRSETYKTLFTAPSRLTTRDKLVDLAVYALSEEYLSLRQAAGLALQ
jgi:tetratricopeptide (TPR) repeat protein